MDTLSANQDPKFKSSKFLQFISKMSKGELEVTEGNQVKDRGAGESAGACRVVVARTL